MAKPARVTRAQRMATQKPDRAPGRSLAQLHEAGQVVRLQLQAPGKPHGGLRPKTHRFCFLSARGEGGGGWGVGVVGGVGGG